MGFEPTTFAWQIASSANGATSGSRPKQQPGATQDRAEQLGLGLATGDLDSTPVVHLGYPNANAKFTRNDPPSVGMCTRANTDI